MLVSLVWVESWLDWLLWLLLLVQPWVVLLLLLLWLVLLLKSLLAKVIAWDLDHLLHFSSFLLSSFSSLSAACYNQLESDEDQKDFCYNS